MSSVATENEGQPEPAFTEHRTLSSFSPEKVLRFGNGGRLAVLLGKLEGQPALLQLEQKPALPDPESLLASLPGLELTLTNHSGAEYSYYDAALRDNGGGGGGSSSNSSTTASMSSATSPSPPGAQSAALAVSFSAEVIWPASARQVDRKTPGEVVLAEETPEVYARAVKAHAESQAGKCKWVDKVLSGEKERERSLFSCHEFVVNVDTKWTTHGSPLSEEPSVRETWRGAPWTSDLYLLAIAKDPALLSLRDLRGEAGAALCEAMRDQLRRQAWLVYGVPASKLRIFFHYHPQFYRLHAHCTCASFVVPGCEVERAHLLTDVASLLRIGNGNYFADHATLTYKVRVGEDLHGILEAAGGLMQDQGQELAESSEVAESQPQPVRCTLKQGERLLAGQRLVSLNGNFFAEMQRDGNLAVYEKGVSAAAAAAAPAAGGGGGNPNNSNCAEFRFGTVQAMGYPASARCNGWKAVMQGDGNLVVRDKQGNFCFGSVQASKAGLDKTSHLPQPTCKSQVAGGPGEYEATLRDDGSLVVTCSGLTLYSSSSSSSSSTVLEVGAEDAAAGV